MPTLNPGIFAHIDAGKTTLLERILFETNRISAPGTIEEGTTESDYLPEEIERGISIQSTVARIPWPNEDKPVLHLQFVDNPGHLDFQTQSNASLLVVDFGLVLIDAYEGLKSQTFQNVEALRKAEKPILFFLNKLDKADSEVLSPLVDLETALGAEPELLFKEDGTYPILSNLATESELIRFLEWDPVLSEKYLVDPRKLHAIALEGLITGFWQGKIFPVLGGSALKGTGVKELLQILHLLAPGKPKLSVLPKEALAVVFKHEIHPELGKLIHFQARTHLKKGQEVCYLGQKAKLATLYKVSARDYEEVSSGEEGELLGTTSLELAPPGQILWKDPKSESAKGLGNLLLPVRKQFQIVLEPERSEDRDSLWEALQQLKWVDEGIETVILPETGQFRLSGMGELHLEVALSRLKQFFTKNFQTSGIKVASFELWKKLVEQVAFQHTAFDQKISSGQVLASLESSNSFSKGVRFKIKLPESVEEAITSAFFEVTARGREGDEILGLNLVVEDYKSPLGVSESAFELSALIKVAVIKGLKDIIPGHTELIGPLTMLEILLPEIYLGDVLASLAKRESKIRKVVTVSEGRSLIQASAASRNLLGFSGVLRNMAQGRGVLSLDTLFDFDHHSVLH
ncbi:elongation factor G-like protein [Leptospira perolatii]|uniref:elongation factor G-like protein n=1 Tax=Leptospira perolatii TaxID=2023191 RepID=UPI0013FDBD5D|nr:elongation factor G-like protein [Leptospira perolatii]